jgi:putative SOS response-associated peptidase YedK
VPTIELLGGKVQIYQRGNSRFWQARASVGGKQRQFSTKQEGQELAANRCLVPADAYYEWQAVPGGKQPYAFARQDGAPMMLAGLWDVWQGADGARLRSFTLITTAANDIARPIHDRMPVIVEAEGWPLWLGEEDGDAGALLRPAGAAILKAWPVSRRVNSPANNDAQLLDEMH